MEKERDYLWDNIKALLIFLVVAGHVLEGCGFHSSAARFADYFIYSFHMPAFIFASGFWAKSYCKNGRVRGKKVGTFLAYYILFEAIFLIIKAFCNPVWKLTPFSPCKGLWYLLALIAYYSLIPVVEKLPAWLVLPVTVALALLIGRDRQAANYLGVSRIVSFAPYFFAGYYLSADKVSKLRSINPCPRVLLGFAAAAASSAIWILQRNTFSRYLFFAKFGYKKLGVTTAGGMLLRLECFVIAALMIFALLMVMPGKKTFFSYIGSRSLQIFLFHVIIMELVVDSGVLTLTINTTPQFLLGMLVAVTVTLLLSLKPFSYPFDWIQKGVDKLYSVKEK